MTQRQRLHTTAARATAEQEWLTAQHKRHRLAKVTRCRSLGDQPAHLLTKRELNRAGLTPVHR